MLQCRVPPRGSCSAQRPPAPLPLLFLQACLLPLLPACWQRFRLSGPAWLLHRHPYTAFSGKTLNRLSLLLHLLRQSVAAGAVPFSMAFLPLLRLCRPHSPKISDGWIFSQPRLFSQLWRIFLWSFSGLWRSGTVLPAFLRSCAPTPRRSFPFRPDVPCCGQNQWRYPLLSSPLS